MKINKKGPLFHILQVAVLLAIAYFLGRNLYVNWHELISYDWDPDVWLLLLSLFITVAGGLLVALGWSYILRVMGQRVPHPRVLRIYYLSELAKYIPGKIWTAVGRIIMLQKEDVPKVVTAASVGAMLIILAVSGGLTVLLTLPAWPSLDVETHTRMLYLLLILPIGLLILHPRIFEPGLSWLLKKIDHVSLKIRLRYSHILLLVLYWCGLWLLKGVATYFLLRAVYHDPLPPFSWLILAGIMAISWIVGAITPFAPAGLGITEFSMVLLFASLLSIDAGIATAFAIFNRAWSILAELICVGVTFRLKGTAKSPMTNHETTENTEGRKGYFI